MFSRFKKKKPTTLFSPSNGTLIPLAQVDDPVFSKGMMGPGLAIEPTSEEIYSPIDGVVTSVFPTKHAISLTTEDGKSLLLHIGIDTVELDGKGFEIFVKDNQKVTRETLLAKIDRNYLKGEGKKDTLILLFPEEELTIEPKEKVVTTHEVLFELAD